MSGQKWGGMRYGLTTLRAYCDSPLFLDEFKLEFDKNISYKFL